MAGKPEKGKNVRLAPADIAEHESLLSTLIGNMQDALIILSFDGNVLFANMAAARLVGLDNPESGIGANIAQFVDPASLDKAVSDLTTILQTGGPISTELRLRKNDGSIVWAETMGIRIQYKGQNADLINIRDITERKRIEDKLRESEQTYRTIIDSIEDVFYRSDREGNLIMISPSGIRLLGYDTEEDLLGHSIAEKMYANPPDRARFLAALAEQGVVRDYEVSLRKRDGSVVTVATSTHYYRDAAGNIAGVEGIFRDITAARKAEQQLQLLAKLLGITPASITVHDAEGRFLYANQRTFELHGYTRDEFMARNLHDIDVPASEKMIAERISLLRENGEASFGVEHFRKDGSIFPLHVTIRPIQWNSADAILSVAFDITERKKAEDMLRIVQEKYSKAFLAAPNAITISELDSGRFVEVNDAAFKIFGYARHEMIGKSALELGILLNKKDREDLVNKIKTGGRVMDYEIKERRKSGEIFDASITADTLTIGNTEHLITIIHDITNRRRAEDALRESEERYRTLFDKLPEYVIVHRNGILLYVNPAAAEHLGYENKALVGKPVTLFVEPEYHSIVKKAIMQRIAGDVVEPYEIRITTKDGSSHAILVNGAQVHYDGAMAILNVLTDITTIKKAEEAIRQANENLERRVVERTESLSRSNIQLEAEIKARNAAEQEIHKALGEKDLLLREIHHRVKNNLQIIASMLNLQSRTIKDQNVLDAIKDSQSRVRAMALVHERIYRSHNIGEIDLRDYIDYLVKQLFMFHNIPYAKVAITFRMEPVFSDIDTIVPIGLIINEMVSNTLKHAFPGDRKGSIIIEGTTLSPDLIRFTYQDDGVGIPADIDWKKPTSLGLRLITSLVEQLSGEITLERGAGTKYTFTLHPKKPLKKPESGERHN